MICNNCKTGLPAVLVALLGLVGRPAVAEVEVLDLTQATIPEIHAAVDAGALTYEGLLRSMIERIAAYDGGKVNLNSVISINPQALFMARALDKEYREKGRRSDLHGIPLALKDNIDVLHTPTTGGAIAMKHAYPPNDAFVIQKLKEGGGIPFIKVNLSEFASGTSGLPGAGSLSGQPRNAYNDEVHAGSSSSGTGLSLAASFAQAGLGTETGSSVRGPTMQNSLAGIAPTEGLISRDGVIPLSFTLDRVGVMARNVTDVAITLTHCVGVDYGDQVTTRSLGNIPSRPYQDILDAESLQGTRIGVVREVFTSDDPETEETRIITARAIEDLKAAGATVVDPVSTGIPDIMEFMNLSSIVPNELKLGLNAYLSNMGPEAPGSLEALLEDGGILYGKFERYQQALEAPGPGRDPEYAKHVARRGQLRNTLLTLMEAEDLDALFYLHNLYPAQYINVKYPYTKVRLSSVSGLPAVVVPGGYTSLNQPVGVEFLAGPFQEGKLLSLAYSYEQATRHRKNPELTPPLPTDFIPLTPSAE